MIPSSVGSVLVAITALVSIGVMFFVARRILSGTVVPIEIARLQQEQQTQIMELRKLNAALQQDRSEVQQELRRMVKESTEANYAINAWLTRYETLGGFASPPGRSRRQEDIGG